MLMYPLIDLLFIYLSMYVLIHMFIDLFVLANDVDVPPHQPIHLYIIYVFIYVLQQTTSIRPLINYCLLVHLLFICLCTYVSRQTTSIRPLINLLFIYLFI